MHEEAPLVPARDPELVIQVQLLDPSGAAAGLWLEGLPPHARPADGDVHGGDAHLRPRRGDRRGGRGRRDRERPQEHQVLQRVVRVEDLEVVARNAGEKLLEKV